MSRPATGSCQWCFIARTRRPKQSAAPTSMMLYEQGKLVRDGKGSLADPYTYSIAPLNGDRHDRALQRREPFTGFCGEPK